jgi:hypothetical protein
VIGWDAIDSATYQALTFLAGALTNHLATTAQPLPRMVQFHLKKNFPALKLSHRLYYCQIEPKNWWRKIISSIQLSLVI